jgi:hypothetical protein
MERTACTEPQSLYKGAIYLYLLPTIPAWEAGIEQLVYRLGHRLDVRETMVRFPAVKRDSSKLFKPDLNHKQPPIQRELEISFSRGEAAAAWSLSLPSNVGDKNEVSYNSSPPYALMLCTGTPAPLPIIYTYASHATSSVFDQIPVCTVHLPCASRTSYPPLFVMLMTSSKGTNCDPNIKNRKCLRARHSDWLVSRFPTSDSGVNKKKNRVYDHRLWSSISGFPHQPELVIQFTTPCREYTYQFAILHLSAGDFYFPFPPSQISNSK